MKKIMVLLAMLLVLSTFAAARQTVVTSANEMKIDLLRYDPSPVQPGDTTDIWFELINLKDQAVNDFAVTLVEDYPFMVVSDKVVTFSSLDKGGKLQVKFQVEVNKNALAGSYNVNIQYNSRTAGTITSSPFIVSVQKLGSLVSASVDVTPAQGDAQRIAPGSAADVAVSVKNPYDSVMKDVTVKLDLSSSSMPFAPVGMTTEQKIKQINPGDEGRVSYKLVATPDATAGVYKIPLTIKYYDETGTLYNISDVVGVMVGAEPKISVTLDSTELTTKNKMGKVVLKVVNYGTEDVKFARIKLAEGDDFELLSTPESYIGNIDSDDYETAEFRLKAGSGTFMLPVALEYMDSNNKQYSAEENVEVVLYSPGELGIKSGSTWLYVLALVIAVAGYFGYKKFRKSRQKQ
ncbi:MAG TPA: hypothetical protein HA362_07085 [Nanoarchaeota archaeon]|nr:hypothetical protein [Nanoarchaeota archaeon]